MLLFPRCNELVAALGSLMLTVGLGSPGFAQKIIQRGPFGKPEQVLDDKTHEWSTPLLVASDHEVSMYIPDVTNQEWLKENYRDFEDKGQYVLSMFTQYKTPDACKANQVAWGYGTGEHLKACNDIGYRLRQASIDTHQKSATLILAAMIGNDGQIKLETIEHESLTRTWAELDATTRSALAKATALVAEQMKAYDQKMRDLH